MLRGLRNEAKGFELTCAYLCLMANRGTGGTTLLMLGPRIGNQLLGFCMPTYVAAVVTAPHGFGQTAKVAGLLRCGTD